MQRFLAGVVAWILIGSPAFADSFLVTLKIVDKEKRPVAHAKAATFWNVNKQGKLAPVGDKIEESDATGKLVLRLDDWKQARPVLVLSDDQKLGSLVGVSKAEEGKEVVVPLGPTTVVKGKLGCSETKKAPPWANTMVTAEGFGPAFMQHHNENANFQLVLPAGKFKLGSYGSDVKKVDQAITITGDDKVKDLGTIDMKASEIAKLRGKPLPDWVFAEARGVKPTAKISDYRGKWLMIEFWGYWCGPCVAGALPELIDLYEDQAANRDKFEIIAIHEHEAKTLAEVDKKLPGIKERFWQARDLPFPILLDATGKTAELYGIGAYPTGLLVDPEGKLVGEATAKELEAKLPSLPLARRWARQRDMSKNVFWDFNPTKYTLAKLAEVFKRFSGFPVELDLVAIKAAGFSPDDPLPGMIVGLPVTLNSIENILLAPHGLGIVPAADGKKLMLTKRKPSAVAPSFMQKLHAREINEELDRSKPKADAKDAKPFEIRDHPLDEALALLYKELDMPLALDAGAMRAKKLDAKAKVNGSIGPVKLREGLTRLLEPLGLTFEVRDEVVLVTPKKSKS